MTQITDKPDVSHIPDTYDAAANSAGSYNLAIRCIRLDGIRAGSIQPNLNDPAEVCAARQGQQARNIAAHAFEIVCRGEGASHAICQPSVEFGAGKGIA